MWRAVPADQTAHGWYRTLTLLLCCPTSPTPPPPGDAQVWRKFPLTYALCWDRFSGVLHSHDRQSDPPPLKRVVPLKAGLIIEDHDSSATQFGRQVLTTQYLSPQHPCRSPPPPPASYSSSLMRTPPNNATSNPSDSTPQSGAHQRRGVCLALDVEHQSMSARDEHVQTSEPLQACHQPLERP